MVFVNINFNDCCFSFNFTVKFFKYRCDHFTRSTPRCPEVNKDYAFHWADFNNEPINDWKRFTSSLLSIPMAHQLIGFYTVADESDGVLKVLRSYQYYAAHAISDKVAKTDWKNPNRLGGYIWHTTGSGKTMTSFKSAQLIANSKDADKVAFLLDRIELGTQMRIPLMSATDSDPCRPSIPAHAGRGGEAVWVLSR